MDTAARGVGERLVGHVPRESIRGGRDGHWIVLTVPQPRLSASCEQRLAEAHVDAGWVDGVMEDDVGSAALAIHGPQLAAVGSNHSSPIREERTDSWQRSLVQLPIRPG